ncbi:MAG: c-type cytochrome [Anaerolineae bacterium]
MHERSKTTGSLLLTAVGAVMSLLLTVFTFSAIANPTKYVPPPTPLPTVPVTPTVEPTPLYGVVSYVLPATQENIAAGQAMFNMYCIGCHGAGGIGTNIAPNFVERAPLRLEYITERVRTGSTIMPPWPTQTIPDANLILIVNYLQSIAGSAMRVLTPEQMALAQQVYAQHCQACHGANGQGAPDGSGSLQLTPPRSYGQISVRVRDTTLDAFHGFTTSVLNEGQMQVLAVYVQSFMVP